MDVGLPTTFADLGIENPDKDALMEAATLAASPDDTCQAVMDGMCAS